MTADLDLQFEIIGEMLGTLSWKLRNDAIEDDDFDMFQDYFAIIGIGQKEMPQVFAKHLRKKHVA